MTAAFTIFRCKGCGADLFTSRQDMAEHLAGCEQAAPDMRRLAREWLDAGAPTVRPKRRRPAPGGAGSGGE